MVIKRITDKQILLVLQKYQGVAKRAVDIERDMHRSGYNHAYPVIWRNLRVLAENGQIKEFAHCYGIPIKSKCGITFMLYKLNRVLVMDKSQLRFSSVGLPAYQWDDMKEEYFDAMIRRCDELVDTLGEMLKESTIDWVRHRVVCPKCGHHIDGEKENEDNEDDEGINNSKT